MPDRVAPNIEIDRIPKTKDLRFRKISEDQISLFMKNFRIPETEHLFFLILHALRNVVLIIPKWMNMRQVNEAKARLGKE